MSVRNGNWFRMIEFLVLNDQKSIYQLISDEDIAFRIVNESDFIKT